MMNITFHRKGFANNSSSSHSIIFSKADLSSVDSDTNEFGWGDFVASTKKSKTLYFLICLFNSWCSAVNISSECDMIDEDDLIEFKYKLFFDWLDKNKISDVSNYSKEDLKDLRDILEGGYVDHQSMFTFPSERDDSKGLHVDFIKYWFNEVCKPEFAILGGNDNGESDHSFLDKDSKELGKDIKIIYKHFQETNPKDLLCVYDYKTKEFVISKTYSGDLIKIAAELV